MRCAHTLRKRIFQYTKNLKDVKNSNDQFYFIKPQLPEPYLSQKMERDERLREIRKSNAAIPEEQKHKRVVAEIKNRELVIDGVLQKTHVFPPTARELLSIDDNMQHKIDNLKIYESAVVVDKASSFKGHAIPVKSMAEVCLAYLKIKQMYPDADHAVLAYTVREYTGHHHDGEFGVSPRLLKVLKDKQCSNTAVFVTRIYGGLKLGPRRHVYIEKVAREALNNYIPF